jgi:hypothetical protein
LVSELGRRWSRLTCRCVVKIVMSTNAEWLAREVITRPSADSSAHADSLPSPVCFRPEFRQNRHHLPDRHSRQLSSPAEPGLSLLVYFRTCCRSLTGRQPGFGLLNIIERPCQKILALSRAAWAPMNSRQTFGIERRRLCRIQIRPSREHFFQRFANARVNVRFLTFCSFHRVAFCAILPSAGEAAKPRLLEMRVPRSRCSLGMSKAISARGKSASMGVLQSHRFRVQ